LEKAGLGLVGYFQQRYQKSHRIFRNLLCSKTFVNSAAPKIGSCLGGPFWGFTQPVHAHLFRIR
jgi:hypothetical protein